MKKAFLIPFAVLALFSCDKESNGMLRPVIEGDEVTVTINTTSPKARTTKTTLENNVSYWSAGDKVSIIYNESTSGNWVNKQSQALEKGGSKVSFTATLSPVPDGKYDAYAFYPANDLESSGTKIRLNLPATQQPTGTSFDGNADILLSDAFVPVGTVSPTFYRMGSILRVYPDNASLLNQSLLSFTLTAQSDIAGDLVVNPKTASADVLENGSKTVTVTYDQEKRFKLGNADNYVYMVVAPQTIPAGSKLVFSGETENYTFTRTVDLANAIKLRAGRISPITVIINSLSPKGEE
ncbi:MAG: hypothetical protein J5669_03450 [Bacteroidales bacterium]|nr:hypothetical protein [Bacteroidales bacterium]